MRVSKTWIKTLYQKWITMSVPFTPSNGMVTTERYHNMVILDKSNITLQKTENYYENNKNNTFVAGDMYNNYHCGHSHSLLKHDLHPHNHNCNLNGSNYSAVTVGGLRAESTGSVSGNEDTYLFPEERGLFVSNITLICISLVGNAYMIAFICGQKKARNAHNIAIVSIAVADIAIGLIVIPTYFSITHYDMTLKNSYREDNMTTYLCKLHKYIYCWCKTVKIYSILAMVLDRYYRVTKPTRNSNLTGRCIFFLSFVWFFGAAYNVWEIVLNTSALIIVENLKTGINTTIRQCISSHHFHYLQDGFKISSLTVTYAIPFIAILALYLQMFIKGYYLADSSLPLKSKRRLLMSFLVTFTFYVCQLPSEIMDYVMYSFIISQDKAITVWSVALSKIFETLSFSQGVLCVFCYVTCSSELHLAWKDRCSKIHCPLGRRGRNEDSQPVTTVLNGDGAIQILIDENQDTIVV